MDGFGQGLAQGLQQAQDRQMQFAQLKLQQDFAKHQQKTMETEDQIKGLHLQSLQRKMMGQAALDTMEDENLAQSADMPVTITPQRIAQVMQAAGRAGVDGNEVMNRWALADPTGTIRDMLNKMRPSELRDVAPDHELYEIGYGGDGPQSASVPIQQAGLPQAKAEAPQESATDTLNRLLPPEGPRTDGPSPVAIPNDARSPTGITQNFDPNTGERLAPPETPPIPSYANMSELSGQALPASQEEPAAQDIPTPKAMPAMARGAPPTAQPAGRSARLLIKGKAKPPTENLSTTEASTIGDFSQMYPDKMGELGQSLGHTPSLNEIRQNFTPGEFAAVMTARELRELDNRIKVSKAQGVDAKETAAESYRKGPIGDDAGKYHRFNPQTGMIDGITDTFMSREDANKAGYIPVATTHAEKIERFNDIEFTLKPKIARLEEIATEIITASGGMSAWRQGASLNFDALTRSGQMTSHVDPSTGRGMTLGELVNLYKSQIDTIREPYARSVNGLVGAATERDIQYAGAAFTSLTETKAINAAKFKEISARLDDVERSAVATIFGAQAVSGMKKKEKPLTGAEADTDFLSTLSPEAKQKYLKKSPDDQRRYKRFYLEKGQKALGQ